MPSLRLWPTPRWDIFSTSLAVCAKWTRPCAAVVNETSLIEALEKGMIRGAALDVFEVEPLPVDSPLRKQKNCLLAPHNANSSREARQRINEATVKNLLSALRENE